MLGDDKLVHPKLFVIAVFVFGMDSAKKISRSVSNLAWTLREALLLDKHFHPLKDPAMEAAACLAMGKMKASPQRSGNFISLLANV